MTGRWGRKALLFGLLVAVALGSVGSAAPSGGDSGCKRSPACLEVAATLETVTASQPNAPAYANFTATVTGTSKKKGGEEVELTVSPLAADTAAGFVLFSATPSVGTCALDDASTTLTCSLGKLKRGQVATVDLVLETPQAVGDAALDFAVSPKPRGNSRPVTVTKVITITEPGGETATSFVPEGTPLTLDADKSGQEQSSRSRPRTSRRRPSSRSTTTDEIPFTCPK